MTTRPGIRDLVSTALAALVLSVLVWAGGCGRTEGLADRYRAERLAWQAMKLSRAMRTNPDLATDEMRGRLEDTYRAIIASFPPPGDPASMSDLERDVAEIAGRSRSGLALMALGRGDTGEAIRLYASLRDSYAFDPVLSRDGAFALASVYEETDRWEEAVSTYEGVIGGWEAAEPDAERVDLLLLRIPTRIATGYLLRGQEAEARRQYARARERYADWESRWPGSPVGAAAAELSAETLSLEGRWAEAVAAYESFDNRYGDDSNRDRVWMTLAELYETRLGKVGRADEYYSRIVGAYPNESEGGAAAIALAVHEIDRGEYERARRRLTDVISRFHDEEALGATASHYLALSHEREGRWDIAVQELNRLAATYPTTMYGLAALMHVAEHFESIGESEAAETALERAAEHYVRVARDYADTPAELASRNYLIRTRLEQQRWADAADALLETAHRYPDSPASASMALRAAELIEDRLGDPERARSIRDGVEELRRANDAEGEAGRGARE